MCNFCELLRKKKKQSVDIALLPPFPQMSIFSGFLHSKFTTVNYALSKCFNSSGVLPTMDRVKENTITSTVSEVHIDFTLSLSHIHFKVNATTVGVKYLSRVENN